VAAPQPKTTTGGNFSGDQLLPLATTALEYGTPWIKLRVGRAALGPPAPVDPSHSHCAALWGSLCEDLRVQSLPRKLEWDSNPRPSSFTLDALPLSYPDY
jgi:hypothetical protein